MFSPNVAAALELLVEEIRAEILANVDAPPLPRRHRTRVRVGDDGGTDALGAAVLSLIRRRPCPLREIVDATGARRSRISGAITRLRRTHAIENRGNGRIARWYLPKESAHL